MTGPDSRSGTLWCNGQIIGTVISFSDETHNWHRYAPGGYYHTFSSLSQMDWTPFRNGWQYRWHYDIRWSFISRFRPKDTLPLSLPLEHPYYRVRRLPSTYG